MNKKITIISLTALTLGMFVQLLPIFTFTPYKWITDLVNLIRVLSPNLNLSYIDRWFSYYNSNIGFEINFLDLSIYILILIGITLYIISKGKEIRLLRMTFSVILITKALTLFSVLMRMLFYKGFFQADNDWFLSIVSIFSIVFWLLCSYFIVKQLSHNIQLKRTFNSDNTISKDFIDSPKSQRFLHHILDLFLSIIICSRFVIFILMGFLEKVEDILGERIAFYIVIIASRLLYNVLFEYFFKSSPAKFLTGSTVIMLNGDKLNFKTTFLRNLARNVPFEAFSYLDKGNGWHDKWLNTKVVKEENKGVPVRRYLWIFLIFLKIGILSYTGHEFKDRYESYKWEKNNYEQKIKRIKESLSNLSPEYFLKLDDIMDVWETGHDTYYLKVNIVTQNSVVFEYFKMEEYKPTVYQIEKYYERNKYSMQIIEVQNTDLLNSYTKDYDDYKEMDRKGFTFFPESGKQHYISEIYRGYKPNITLLTTGGYGYESISIELGNDGWPAELIDITNLQGNLLWSNSFPEEIITKKHYLDRGIILRAENFERGKPYKFKLSISDSLGRKERFMIEGVNSERTMKKIIE